MSTLEMFRKEGRVEGEIKANTTSAINMYKNGVSVEKIMLYLMLIEHLCV